MAEAARDVFLIPGTQWRPHDVDRPQPRVVTPGNLSALAAISPPSDALILFNGSNLDAWVSCKDGGPAPWKLVDGNAMQVAPKTACIQTRQHFGDIQLHLEWSAPTEIFGDGQKRGNSGVFLMDKYEVQILDGYENKTYADGITAAIYGQYPPEVNACCKPGAWHIYDIVFLAPIFVDNRLVRPAYITVIHNGVVVQYHKEILGLTRKRQAGYEPHAPKGPLSLQDHGDPVRFRNIWVRELNAAP